MRKISNVAVAGIVAIALYFALAWVMTDCESLRRLHMASKTSGARNLFSRSGGFSIWGRLG